MPSSAKKHILLIEDDFYLGRMYSRVLKKNEYTVTLVDNGNDGVSALIGQRPDLVLLDLLLPGLGGLQVLEIIKGDAKTKDIPVIILSNLEKDSIMDKALQMGANGYWIKVVMLPQDLVTYVQDFFTTPKEFHDPKQILFPKSFYSQVPAPQKK